MQQGLFLFPYILEKEKHIDLLDNNTGIIKISKDIRDELQTLSLIHIYTLFVITTDGMENASRRYDSEKVKKVIERQKEKYGWEILFLGANIDEVETAKHFRIGADRAVNYHSDREGTQLNYEVLSEAVSAVRCSVPLGTNWKKRIDEDFNSRKDGRKQ